VTQVSARDVTSSNVLGT